MGKTRPHGTGSITQRKDGRFQGAYHLENGKKKYVYGKTKAECNRKLLAAIKANKQEKARPKPILLKNYMLSWLASRVDYRANSEQQRALSIKNHIIPALGDEELTSITRDKVKAFVAGLVALGLAPATVRAIYEALSAAMSSALEDNLIEATPCARIKLPPKVRAEHTILDLPQAHRLCAEMAGHWLEPIVKLAIATGMRKSELIALEWKDVDFSKGVLYVRHNVAYLPKKKFVPGPPKSKSSVRTISLTQFSVETLKEHRIAQMLTRDVWAKSDLVFPNHNGTFRTPSTLNHFLDRMIERAGVPRVKFHELRHSAASILIVLKVNIKIIQELLGHSGIQTTLDLYAHLLPSAQGEAMQQYHDAWERAKLEQMDVKTDVEGNEKGA